MQSSTTFLVCNLQYHMNSARKMDLLHIVFILHIYFLSFSSFSVLTLNEGNLNVLTHV